MAAKVALAAVRPLLGLLQDEVQLLRGVHGDVQFMRDEMESVKAFLMNLEARSKVGGRGDHQVRAWIEQVMVLAYDSKNCMDGYAQTGRLRSHDACRGVMRRMKWVVRLPRRIIARRRIAARIRKLKVRAQEISDRQQRYAVVVPTRRTTTTDATTNPVIADVTVDLWDNLEDHSQPPPTHPAKDSPRWDVLSGPDIMTEANGELLRWLAVKPEDYHTRPWPSVLAVVTPDGVDGASLAEQVCKQCTNNNSSGEEGNDLKFDCAVRITIQNPPFLLDILFEILSQLHIEPMGNGIQTSKLVEEYTETLKVSLTGKRLLLLLLGLDHQETWNNHVKRLLQKLECSAGSAVVVFTDDEELAANCSPHQTKLYSLVGFYFNKAISLVPSKFESDEDDMLRRQTVLDILTRCTPDVNCMDLLVRALLSNPNRTVQELKSLYLSLAPEQCSTTGTERQKRMLMFCFDGLHKDYQNCLWYSAVFTGANNMVRRASLLRRWVAEGLIKGRGGCSAMAEAERCFDALFTQDLLSGEVGDTGKIKTCGLNFLFTQIFSDTAATEKFLDADRLPVDLQLHFSIRNGIQLRNMIESNKGIEDSIIPTKKQHNMKNKMKRMMAFLKYLPSSSSFRLLRVLELEGFKGFKKSHLKNICKIHQLKYLSLRDTNVVLLPRKMDQLLQLETLDIRGTKVQQLNAVLPMLKNLLAGHTENKFVQEDTIKSNELFTTVKLPKDISKMDNLEILSHVKIYKSSKDLMEFGDNFKNLRKLGVVLCGKKSNLNDLFQEIDKLNGYLVSLSIRVEPPVNWDTVVDYATLMAPKLLESLTICGVRGWLPAGIQDLHRLIKITLRDTNLKESDLAILGSLGSLQCLRLRYHSFAEAALYFREGQFDKLIELVIEDDNLRNLIFDRGTSPKLSTMVWSFTRMDSITGIKNLVSLKSLELNRGRCDSTGLKELQQDVSAHPNYVCFSLNPPEKIIGTNTSVTAP